MGAPHVPQDNHHTGGRQSCASLKEFFWAFLNPSPQICWTRQRGFIRRLSGSKVGRQALSHELFVLPNFLEIARKSGRWCLIESIVVPSVDHSNRQRIRRAIQPFLLSAVWARTNSHNPARAFLWSEHPQSLPNKHQQKPTPEFWFYYSTDSPAPWNRYIICFLTESVSGIRDPNSASSILYCIDQNRSQFLKPFDSDEALPWRWSF